jgi:hypothetical protein
MNVEILSICDAATTSPGGKLNVLGAFDALHMSRFPSAHPQCTIAMRIRFNRMEEGHHKVALSFVDADGKRIMPDVQGDLNVRIAGDEPSIVTNLVINIHQLKIPQPGYYSIDLAIDSRHESSLPIVVRELPASNNQSQGEDQPGDNPSST